MSVGRWRSRRRRRGASRMRSIRNNFPISTRVRVVEADLDEYVGACGRVADYDPGDAGSPPLIGVIFDKPILADGEKMVRDGFYENELIVMEE